MLNLVAHLEHHANDKPIDLRVKTSVRRIDWCDGTWSVQTTADAIDATHIVVATGYEREPHIPEWPGRQTFTGELLHSSAYRTAWRLPVGLHRNRHVPHASWDRRCDGGGGTAILDRRSERDRVAAPVRGRVQYVVICATGYRRGLEPLVGHLGVLDDRGVPLEGVVHLADRGLWFLGFQSRTGLIGAVAKRSRRIAMAITDDLAARRPRIPIPGPSRG